MTACGGPSYDDRALSGAACSLTPPNSSRGGGPLSMLEQYAKRILDIAGASAALVVLALFSGSSLNAFVYFQF